MDPNSSSYPVWNDFFLGAGIPNTVAHEYAITFSQHRIRIDMLREITKEILLDMGIKAMGDIIAILRHAKNLATQDELKIGVKTTTSVSNNMASQPTSVNLSIAPTVNHLAQRTPISTNRSGPSISSLVGNKIQSKVSLNSGALAASSNGMDQAKTKRPSSTISSSLAKRLKPGDGSINNIYRGGINLLEKTLTVHYPSSSAIAKAQQRVQANNPVGSNVGKGLGSVSIKSRLGTSTTEISRLRSDDTATNYSDDDRRNWSSSKNYNSKNGVRSSSNSKWSDRSRRQDGIAKKDNTRQQTGRLKSTVFHRLGESAR